MEQAHRKRTGAERNRSGVERRAAQQHFWAAACGELQATGKPRTVGRVSSGQFARSLRRSRVRARISSPCAVACGRRWWQRAYEPTLWQATVVVRPMR
eukprot:scaffold84520_cov66-Phaeocystis_antarctica.AAC.2